MVKTMRNCINRSKLCRLLAAAFFLLPAFSVFAQESDRDVNPTGLGVLMGLALGKNLPTIGLAAGAGAAGAVIAIDALDNYYYGTGSEHCRPRVEGNATYRKVGPSQQKNEYEEIAAIQAAMGPENYIGYQALRNCEFERAYALATAGTLSRDNSHRLVGYWLEAMISVEERNQEHSTYVFEQLVNLDPEVDSVEQAVAKTEEAVLQIREERRRLGLPACRQ